MRIVRSLSFAVLTAACADAVTAPLPAVPQPRTDVSAVLQHRVEGVRVLPSVVIRWCCACPLRPGSPDEQPLIIVDGLRWEQGTTAGIDPGQIVDIEILKGPSATQRYGPAARHGVILIRTKALRPGDGAVG